MLAADTIQGLIALTHTQSTVGRAGTAVDSGRRIRCRCSQRDYRKISPGCRRPHRGCSYHWDLAQIIMTPVLASRNNSRDAFLQFRDDNGWHSTGLDSNSLVHICKSPFGDWITNVDADESVGEGICYGCSRLSPSICGRIRSDGGVSGTCGRQTSQ